MPLSAVPTRVLHLAQADASAAVTGTRGSAPVAARRHGRHAAGAPSTGFHACDRNGNRVPNRIRPPVPLRFHHHVTVRLIAFLALLLVTLGALAGAGRSSPDAVPQAANVAAASSLDTVGARPWSGPRHVAADAGAAFQPAAGVEAFDAQGDSDDRAEAMPAVAARLSLPARPRTWAAAVVSRALAPCLAGPRRPPRPIDA